MDLDQLRALVAAVEHGSIAGAADALGISRPTLRGRVAALEAEVDARLIERSNRGITLTAVGAEFVEGARVILADADALVGRTRRAGQEAIGALTVRVPVAGFPPMMAVVLARELRRRHPGLTLRVASCVDPIRAADGETDVVLHFGELVPEGPFRTFVLRRFPVRLLASRRYLDARGRPASLADLAEHDLIAWTGPAGDGAAWPLRAGGTLAIEPAFEGNVVMTLRAMAAGGLGIACLPDDPVARAALPGEALEGVLPALVGREGTVRVLVRADGSARTRALTALLREVAQGVFGVEALPGSG